MQYVEREFQRRFAIINNSFFNTDRFKGQEQVSQAERQRRVVGHLPEMPPFTASASWEEGTVGKILNIFAKAINLGTKIFQENPDALLRTIGLTQWSASSPLEVTLPLVFHRNQPIGDERTTGIDINENINKLVSLTVPAGLRLEGRAFSAPAGFTAGGGENLLERLNNLTKSADPLVRGLSSIKIVQNGRLLLATERFFACTSVSIEYSPQMDGDDGYLWIKAAATFQTIAPITIDRFIRWFIRPRKIGSFSTGQVDINSVGFEGS